VLCLSFSHSPLAPHTPHAFPTRRSSDLSRRAVKRPSAVSSAPRGAKGLRRSAAAGASALEGVSEEDPEGRANWFYFKRAYPSGTDRKSTRLNSSHLGISYAVFCLKKKKT